MSDHGHNDLRARLPQIQTQALPPDGAALQKPPHNAQDSTQQPAKQATHQRLVLTDPVAFKYLEEDPTADVLERRRELEGYECYIIEQWACSRTHPTFLITTFSGDSAKKVNVSVLSVPTDQRTWSQRLKIYFKALDHYHARPKETPLGTLMITNLSGFPSSLTVIPIPDGDIRRHREDFIVNENLKRLGCSGRVGLTLAAPNGATVAKFHQLYRTSDKIPLYSSVIELVKLCQAALTMFDKLRPEYVDGLLCDVTEKAINDWWIDVGAEYFNVEPHDGILGPTTVAALLGLFLGARNRLNAYGSPVSKDAFDLSNTKRGIAYFQKNQHLSRSRRLDRQTLARLHVATAKAAAGEGWLVPRAVKSTVAELSGKGGEMVMEMVGRDRTGISEIESEDFDHFVQLAYGERCKWLWHGKKRKLNTTDALFGTTLGESQMQFRPDDQGGYKWSSGRRESIMSDDPPAEGGSVRKAATDEPPSSTEADKTSPPPQQNVVKRATDKMSDARSGLSRLKGAVGLRGHHGRQQDSLREAEQNLAHAATENNLAATSARRGSVSSVPKETLQRSTRLQKTDEDVEDDLPSAETESHARTFGNDHLKSTNVSDNTDTPTDTTLAGSNRGRQKEDEGEEGQWLGMPAGLQKDDLNTQTPTANGSVTEGEVPNDEMHEDMREGHRTPKDHFRDVGYHFRRSLTSPAILTIRHHGATEDDEKPREECSDDVFDGSDGPSECRVTRNLSFSIAEDGVLTWDPIIPLVPPPKPDPQFPITSGTSPRVVSNLLEPFRRTRLQIHDATTKLADWNAAQIQLVSTASSSAERAAATVEEHYYPRLSDYQRLRDAAQAAIASSRAGVEDHLRDVEMETARLEYEIGVLRGKVEDVEDGVWDLERMLLQVESRVGEVAVEQTEEKAGKTGEVLDGNKTPKQQQQQQQQKQSWARWLWRGLTGPANSADSSGSIQPGATSADENSAEDGGLRDGSEGPGPSVK